MATIHEEFIIIKVSKLYKGNEQPSPSLSEEIKNQLEVVVQELVGSSAVVEIEEVDGSE